VSIHTPTRLSWICVGCGDHWPCEPARGRLLARFDGAAASLSLYLAHQFVVACEHLPDAPAGALHLRFLGWTSTVR
jgi:hypothetical protein